MSRSAFEHAYREALRKSLASEMLPADSHHNLTDLAQAAGLNPVDVLIIHQQIFHELPAASGDAAPDYRAAAIFCQTQCDALAAAAAEHQALNQPLSTHEQRFHALFDRATDAVFLARMDQSYLDFNQAALDLLGYTREELLAKKVSEILVPEENADSRLIRERLLTGQRIPVYTRRIVRKDGKHLTCEIDVLLVRDDAGNPLYIQSIVHDVTEQRELLASLRQSQYFIEQVTRTIPDTIYLVDMVTDRITYVNRSLGATLGYDEGDHTSAAISALVHPDDLAVGVLSQERFRAFDSGSTVIESEFRLRNAKGVWEWMFVRETPFERDEHGKITRVLAVAQNFTQRKELESALKLTRRSVEVSNVGITIADVRLPDMPIIAVNPAFCHITGYSEAETLGRNCRFLQGTETNQAGLEELRQAIKQGKECKVLLCNFRKDGSLFWNDLHVSPIYDDANQLIYFVGVQTDVTEIVETQLRIQDALQLAQNANQMKNRFISMVSHEFRTPLAVIRSTAETLRDFYDRMNAEQRLRRFMTIDAQIARIGAMLEDLLTLGKLESSSVTLSQELLDLNTWLDSLLEEFVAAHQTHRIATQIEQELLVVADRTLLRQILTNLLSNAIKYSGASNLVELKVWKVDRELWMEVRDYGIGIPTEDLDHLFTEFKRASNVGTIQGTGLGLVIVHRAVSLQGGTIDIQSTLGTGTTVTISMPVIHHD